jgi:hypothetical protein
MRTKKVTHPDAYLLLPSGEDGAGLLKDLEELLLGGIVLDVLRGQVGNEEADVADRRVLYVLRLRSHRREDKSQHGEDGEDGFHGGFGIVVERKWGESGDRGPKTFLAAKLSRKFI